MRTAPPSVPSAERTDPRQPNTASVTAYGVDGCKAGWFYFAVTPSGKPRWGIVETIGALVSNASDLDRIFVDIPIGLPCGPEGRRCDREARAKLGRPGASSVFPAPVRKALDAATYDDASRLSREASGKGMTMQTFAILPRIREVDGLLRGSESARRIVREVHPEICFWAFAGGRPMRRSKKTSAGFEERLAQLERSLPSVREDFRRIRPAFRCRELADDDILDAMAAAITAWADPAALQTLPEKPPTDCCGLPMVMVYVKGDWWSP